MSPIKIIGKLKYKLIAIILLITLVALFSYLAFVTFNHIDRLKKEMAENTLTISNVVSSDLVGGLAFMNKDNVIESIEVLSSVSYIDNALVFDMEGNLFGTYRAEGADEVTTPPGDYFSGYKGDYFIVYQKIVHNNVYYGDIYLRASTDHLNKKIWDYLTNILIFIVFLLAAIFFMTWRLQRYISGPILRLAESFRRVSNQRDYSLRLEKPSRDEIGTLYDGFNEMLEQVNQHQQELKEHKENLEAQVEERTKELKQKNLQLLKAKDMAENANRLKSAFLANMSHEIRTPMNAILGFTNILMEEEGDTEKNFYLNTVKKSGENLLKLINNILDLSKIEANRLEISREVFSPRQMFYHLDTMFSIKAQENNLYFKITGLQELPAYVWGDSHRLNQVLLNILANAFKFTTTGGITITCRYDTPTLAISIKDTGIGISAEQKKVIFNPFTQADSSTTRKYGGTGLGLSISLRMINLMGGNIELNSELGQGSEFKVFIPLPEAEPVEEIPKAALDTDEKRPKSIALLEDIENNRELIGSLLLKQGFKVMTLQNDGDITEQVLRRKPDIVMVALHLDEMKGYKINDRLKRDLRTAHIPVILYCDPTEILHSFSCSIMDYIKKPVGVEEVLKRVYSVMQLYGGVKNVFVVDEDRGFLNGICNFLSRRNYNCYSFNSAIDALKKTKSGVQPDFIILDPVMPFMDGFEFLKLLRNKGRHANPPVILVTGKRLTLSDLSRLRKDAPTGASKENGTTFVHFLEAYFKRRESAGKERVQLWLNNMEDDEQLHRILVEGIAALPEKVGELEQAIAGKDIDRIGFLSHSLKGMSLNLGMTEIANVSEEINRESRKKSPLVNRIIQFFIELKDIVSTIPADFALPGTAEPVKEKLFSSHINILVAEDDSINQKLIGAYFKRMGRTCDIAENGQVALDMLRKNVYDILFLDIQMPVLDGVQTVKAIRADEHLKGLHVIALTANAVRGDQERYLEAGCDDYMSKPVTLEALSERLKKFEEEKG